MYLAKYKLCLMRKSTLSQTNHTTARPHPPLAHTSHLMPLGGCWASLGADLGLGTAISGPVVHSVYLRRLGGTFEVPYADLLGL